MSTAVQKWGNSLGIRIPKEVARHVGLTEGMRVNVVAEDGRIVVHAVKVPDLNELLARIDPGSRPESVDWGQPVGKEVW